ncbi:tRNA (adenosine(37)-N6)-threonylcarbamoyltransferase complex ATPase subunit type 1 TsaE [Castellaniella hirudinis]|uniref:tRNA (adenosine(37)-N6)-threonylcarbamoyltransferase complex ATPase subunit type 1 TsaE n=1 Tax=Castellaniella hirudinis TaxID=1144617 RepID=UPI0039C1F23E
MTIATSPMPWALPDENATTALAAQLAGLVCGQPPLSLPAGGRIHLRGELGAGKTSLARAFLRAAGVAGRIKSPSYALLESYNVSSLHFYHFDFYRFSDAHEWRDAGFDELLADQAVVLIEWPEQAGTRLPPPDLDIFLEYAGDGRCAWLRACSEKGQLWLQHLTPSPHLPHPPPCGAN